MKHGKRVVSLLVAFVVALGSVCYRPASASAFAITSAVVSSATTAYLGSLGFEFMGMQSYYNGMTDTLESGLRKLEQEFSESIEIAHDEFQQVVSNGIEFLEDGYLRYSYGTVDLLNRFADWIIDKFGLMSDDGVPSALPVGIVAGASRAKYNGVEFPSFAQYIPEGYPYITIMKNSSSTIRVYFTKEPLPAFLYNGVTYVGYQGQAAITPYKRIVYNKSNAAFTGAVYDETNPFNKSESDYIWSNYDVKYADGSIFALYTPPVTTTEDWSNPLLSLALSSDYETPPIASEQYSMVVDTGLTFTDEQEFINSVLTGAVAGTLAPTYAIEQAPAGDVVVPDEDEERVGILNWVKTIAQDVKALPKTIAEGIANVFVPSAEYMETVPVVISDTFDNRTGFLTYPSSVLYDLGDRLTAGHQDFILRWPTVREPYSKSVIMAAGQFNVSAFIRENDSLSSIYEMYQWVVSAYLTFLFLGLCKRKYNSIVGDSLGG